MVVELLYTVIVEFPDAPLLLVIGEEDEVDPAVELEVTVTVTLAGMEELDIETDVELEDEV